MELNINKYEKLILELPLENHGFLIKYENWNKNLGSEFEKVNRFLFNSKKDISINRKMLFSLGKISLESLKVTDFEKFILHVLAWGYPTGRIGTYKNSRKVFDNTFIEKMASSFISFIKSEEKDIVKLKKLVNDIDGLGLSSLTKVLYFLDININNLKPAILDLQIIEVLNSNIFYNSNDNIILKYGNVNHYLEYLTLLNKEKIDVGKIEMFLFIFGKSLI